MPKILSGGVKTETVHLTMNQSWNERKYYNQILRSMSVRTQFLGNIKLIFEHGVHCSKNKSRLQRLLAIHELHYVVEQILRERYPQYDQTKIDVKHERFIDILNALNKKQSIPDKESLLHLNDDRNRAEHSNRIPPYEEIQHYVVVVRNFLRWS